MFKATIERLRQLMGLAAIAILAVLPFVGSIANFGQHASIERATALEESAKCTVAPGFPMDYRTPSYEELGPAFEQVRSARVQLLRCAALEGAGELETAVRHYQNAIRIWKLKFGNVQERTFTEEARDIWYDFCAMPRSDEGGRRAYEWEIDEFAATKSDEDRNP